MHISLLYKMKLPLQTNQTGKPGMAGQVVRECNITYQALSPFLTFKPLILVATSSFGYWPIPHHVLILGWPS